MDQVPGLPQRYDLLSLLMSVLLAFILIGLYRIVAIRLSLVDVPNERSSHDSVTPRGAGIVIIFLYSLGALISWSDGGITPASTVLMVFPVVIAMLGMVDDWLDLSSSVKLLSYFFLVVFFVASLAMPEKMTWLGVLPAPLLILVTSVMLLWLINLFNFMDGINGIAGFEALFYFFAVVVVGGAEWGNNQAQLSYLAGAIIGFLCWNFPAGKVFMGDAGSIFLGALIGVSLVQVAYEGSHLFWSYIILLGVFIVDASYTLLVRLFSQQNITRPHRSHAYQKLSRRWGSHVRVVLCLALINLFWLLPLALLPAVWPEYALLIVLCAYLPLIYACHRLGAGLAG